MITDYMDYLKSIDRALGDKPDSVYIASFNLNTGVSARGTVYPSPTFRLLERINVQVPTVYTLIGLPTVVGETLGRVQCTAEKFPKIHFSVTENSHLKCWIFEYGKHIRALAGGRNLGDSQWHDVSWWLSHKEGKELLKYYDHLWGKAKPVKPRTLEKLNITLDGRNIL
jgi:hypothetical protein